MTPTDPTTPYLCDKCVTFVVFRIPWNHFPDFYREIQTKTYIFCHLKIILMIILDNLNRMEYVRKFSKWELCDISNFDLENVTQTVGGEK